MSQREQTSYIRVSQLLKTISECNVNLRDEYFWSPGGKINLFSKPLGEFLEFEGLKIPEKVLAAFGIHQLEENDRWIFAQKVGKQGFIAMQFDSLQSNPTFKDASAIIAVEFGTNKKREKIILSGVGSDNRVLTAKYELNINSNSSNAPEIFTIEPHFVLNDLTCSIIGQENFTSDFLVQKSPYMTAKMSTPSSTFVRIYNPWNDGDINNLRLWSSSDAVNNSLAVIGQLNKSSLKYSFKA